MPPSLCPLTDNPLPPSLIPTSFIAQACPMLSFPPVHCFFVAFGRRSPFVPQAHQLYFGLFSTYRLFPSHRPRATVAVFQTQCQPGIVREWPSPFLRIFAGYSPRLVLSHRSQFLLRNDFFQLQGYIWPPKCPFLSYDSRSLPTAVLFLQEVFFLATAFLAFLFPPSYH